jgi:hypothetical protein
MQSYLGIALSTNGMMPAVFKYRKSTVAQGVMDLNLRGGGEDNQLAASVD